VAARPVPSPAATCGIANQSYASHDGTGSSTATTSTSTDAGSSSGIALGTGIPPGSGSGLNSGMRAGVLRAIGAIVGASSFWQSAKGSLTSRPSTSVRYMWRKFQKAVARK
jgi:hypothetical protein